ncbi:hypothetical protein F4861DRAFT_544583 [Xylaria intraflava]|nr:hypothetical protein F4861DRAFT_544583 [Xylaria intraflava]
MAARVKLDYQYPQLLLSSRQPPRIGDAYRVQRLGEEYDLDIAVYDLHDRYRGTLKPRIGSYAKQMLERALWCRADTNGPPEVFFTPTKVVKDTADDVQMEGELIWLRACYHSRRRRDRIRRQKTALQRQLPLAVIAEETDELEISARPSLGLLATLPRFSGTPPTRPLPTTPEGPVSSRTRSATARRNLPTTAVGSNLSTVSTVIPIDGSARSHRSGMT